MTKRYLGATILVVAAILLTHRFGSNCLPFEASEVSCIRFHFSLLDTVQIVVRDPYHVAAIMDKLQVKAERDNGLYCEYVVFTINDVEHLALVSQHSFNMQGKYHGIFQMPPEFYAAMQAYRDSLHLTEPWDNHGIAYDKQRREWVINAE